MEEKERRAAEKAHVLKMAALRDDDNVFDVSYEGMGDARTAAQENMADVKVHNLTVRAKGKMLLDKTDVTIAAGRRCAVAAHAVLTPCTLAPIVPLAAGTVARVQRRTASDMGHVSTYAESASWHLNT